MDRAVFQLYPAFASNGGLQDGQQPAEDRGPGSPKSTEQTAARGDVEEGGSCCLLTLMTQEQIHRVPEESRSQATELFYHSPSSSLLGIFHIQRERGLSSKILHLIKPG